MTQYDAVASDRLHRLGWNDHFDNAFTPFAREGLVPARVSAQHRGMYIVWTEHAELATEVTGALRHGAAGFGELPAVGDWVAVRELPGEERAVIHAVLPRRSAFSRKVAWSRTEEQVLAANIDVVFLVTSCNADLNLRRLERYLTMAWEGGARPAILLTKADLCGDVDDVVRQVETVALGVPVHPLSSVTGEGLEALAPYLEGDATVALLGSSGVGKSTLVNRLLGAEHLKTQEIRADGRGRHTTSHRELILLAGGGLIVDTPGLRELQLWESSTGLEDSFKDVAELASQCRFSDCRHETEPGCAVREAIAAGTLPAERLDSFRKLEAELAHLERKQDKRLQSLEKKKWAALTKSYRSRPSRGSR